MFKFSHLKRLIGVNSTTVRKKRNEQKAQKHHLDQVQGEDSSVTTSQLEKDVVKLTDALKQETARGDKLQIKLSQAEKSVQKIKDLLNVETQKTSVYESKIYELTANVDNLNTQLLDKEEELSTEKSARAEENSSYKKTLEKLNTELNDKVIEIHKLRQDKADDEKQKSTLENYLTDSKSNNERLQSELTETANVLATVRSNYELEKIDFQTKIDETNSQISSMQDEISRLTIVNAQNESLISQLREKEDQLKEELASLQPYMHLIEVQKKKDEEDRLLNVAIETLKTSINDAIKSLEGITHQQILQDLSSQIEESNFLLNSDTTPDKPNSAKEELDSVLEKSLLAEERLCEEEKAKKIAAKLAQQELEISEKGFRDIAEIATKLVEDLNYVDLKDEFQEKLNKILNDCSDKTTKSEYEEYTNSINELIEYYKSSNLRRCEDEQKIEHLKNTILSLLSQAKRMIANNSRYEDLNELVDSKVSLAELCLDESESDLIKLTKVCSDLSDIIKYAQDEIDARQKEENHVVKRRIPEVFDRKEGNIITSVEFFSRPEDEQIRWRKIFEDSILFGEKRFICTNCQQEVKISGRKFNRGQVTFFSHLYDSDYCEYKTNTGLTKEQIEARKYGLIGESDRHRRLKSLICDSLNGLESQATNVVTEKRIDSYIPGLTWRRPDVMAEYNGMNIVFELQLSTTFISVVVQRDIFYRLNNYFIIWVFNFDDNKKYVDLTNLMCKDIYYANKRNVFIFDKEAQKASIERQELVLKCNWLDADSTWHYSEDKGNGDGILVTLGDLQYDSTTRKPYYFDADTPYYERHPEVKARLEKEELTDQQYLERLKEKIEREKKNAEIEAERQAVLRDAAIREMVENNESVTPYKDGNRYGFRYKDIVIVSPQFTSVEVIPAHEVYKVTFNRKSGLYDKFGNELFGCEYLKFLWLNNGVVIAESTHGFYFLGNGRICERAPHDTIVSQQLSSEVEVIKHNGTQLDVYIVENELILKKSTDSNLYAYYQLNGELASSKTFSSIYFSKDYTKIWLCDAETHNFTLCEINGDRCNEREYENIQIYNDFIVAGRKSGTDVYDGNGCLQNTTNFDSLSKFKETLFLAKKDNKVGLISDHFEEIIPCVYDQIESCNSYYVCRDGEYRGLLDINGNKVSNMEFTRIHQYDRNYALRKKFAVVSNGAKKGLFDNEGHYLIMAEYDDIEVHNSYIVTKIEYKYGLFDIVGKRLLDNNYDGIDEVGSENMLACQILDKCYIYNLEQKFLIEKSFDSVSHLTGKLFGVKIEDKTGVVNSMGDYVVPLKYDDVSTFTKRNPNHYNAFDTNSVVVKCNKNGKICAYNTETKLEVTPFYDDIEWWNGDLFCVKDEDLWGIYKQGDGLVLNVQYKRIGSYDEDKIMVENAVGETGHINASFVEIFSEEAAISNGYTLKQFFGKWGIYDENGVCVIEHIYSEKPSYIGNDLLKIKQNGKYGAIDFRGNTVFSSKYRDIITKQDSKFLIVKNIYYNKEREYTYGRHYHMVDKEYNNFQIYNIDGTQSGLPDEYRGTYNKLSFADSQHMWVGKKLMSLINFKQTVNDYDDFEKFSEEDIYVVVKKNYSTILKGVVDKDMNEVIPCEYDNIVTWSKELIMTSKIINKGYWYSSSKETHYCLWHKNGQKCSIGELTQEPILTDNIAEVYSLNLGHGAIDAFGKVVYTTEKQLNEDLVIKKAFGVFEIYNSSQEILVSLDQKISSVEHLTNNYYVLQKAGECGLLNSQNGVLTWYDFSNIRAWSENYAIGEVSSNANIYGQKEYKLISLSNFVVGETSYDAISDINNGVADAQRNGRKGKLNSMGEECYSENVCLFDNIYKQHIFGLWSVVDNTTQNRIISSEFSTIDVYESKLILCKDINGNNYLFDKQGNNLINRGFQSITKRNLQYIVMAGKMSALFNSEFKAICPFDTACIGIEPWGDSWYLKKTRQVISNVYTNAQVYFDIIDEVGNVRSKQKYTDISQLENGKALVQKGEYRGYINEYCEEIEDEIASFGEYHIHKFLGIYKIIKQNDVVLEHLKEARFLSEFCIVIQKEQSKYYNILHAASNIIDENEYIEIGELEDGKAVAVNEDNISGHIDDHGKVVDSETINIFEGKYVIFKRFGKVGLRNIENLTTIQCQHKDIKPLISELVAILDENENWSIYSCDGKCITEKKYSTIEVVNDIINAERNGHKGALTTEGKEVYSDIEISSTCKIRMNFGEVSIVSHDGQVGISGNYDSISELSEGLYAISKSNSIAISSFDKILTEFKFKKIEVLCNNFLIALYPVLKINRVKKTGYGYYGNPYTYWKNEYTHEDKWGILDNTGKIVLSFNYSNKPSIAEGKINLVKNGTTRQMTIEELTEKANEYSGFEIDKEYDATICGFAKAGIVVMIDDKKHFIPKKFLYTSSKSLSKDDVILMTYKGYDKSGYPSWETSAKTSD